MPKTLEEWKVQPHGPLEEIDEGLLTAAGEIRMPLGNFPRRMTVVRLANNRTAIWSAIALPEPEMQRIEAMGRPSFLIVPDGGHRLDAHIWKERYPDIKVVAPLGAKEAVEEVVPVDATTDVLDDPDVTFQPVGGFGEADAALIVNRNGNQTLICNDVIGNVQHPHGIGAKIMARLFRYGVDEPEVPKPASRWMKDQKAFARQLHDWARIAGLKRIIVSHGDPITKDPAGVLERLAGEMEAEAARH